MGLSSDHQLIKLMLVKYVTRFDNSGPNDKERNKEKNKYGKSRSRKGLNLRAKII